MENYNAGGIYGRGKSEGMAMVRDILEILVLILIPILAQLIILDYAKINVKEFWHDVRRRGW